MKKPLILCIALASAALAMAMAPTRVGAIGEKVVLASDGTIFLISTSERRGFPSAAVYFSHGYKFSDAVTATAEDLAQPAGSPLNYRDGALIKGQAATVYLISGATKHPFSSAEAFLGLGYSFSNVLSESGSILDQLPAVAAIDSANSAHLPGTLINQSGTVFLVTTGGRQGIPSLEAFYAQRYRLEEIVIANSADLALPIESESSTPPPAPEPPSQEATNHSPSAPTITGVIATFPSEGHDFFFASTDADGDTISYLVNWGDGTVPDTATMASGVSFKVNHAWLYLGQYSIVVTVSDGKDGTAQTIQSVKVDTDTSAFGPAVTVLSPVGGETYGLHQPIAITWKRNWYPSQSSGRVDINYSRGGIAASIVTDKPDSSYTWIPESAPPADNYKIIVISRGNAGGGGILSDQSAGTFTINP